MFLFFHLQRATPHQKKFSLWIYKSGAAKVVQDVQRFFKNFDDALEVDGLYVHWKVEFRLSNPVYCIRWEVAKRSSKYEIFKWEVLLDLAEICGGCWKTGGNGPTFCAEKPILKRLKVLLSRAENSRNTKEDRRVNVHIGANFDMVNKSLQYSHEERKHFK